MARGGTVTILFTDVVASTALTARIGDVAWDSARRRHFGMLRDLAGVHGGEVVKSVGDGVMVVFTSTVDGLDAAVAMQRVVRADAQGIEMRVGLSVGEAVREDDGDWYGTPVVEARRLCDACAAGQILTSDIARILVGTRGGHDFRSVGALDLKGFSESVPACEIGWDQPSLDGPTALPQQLANLLRTRFVGRLAEQQQVGAAWQQATENHRGFVLVAGEPGIGKTRLVAEVAARVHATWAIVLSGRCDETVRAPFGPVVDALGPWVGADPSAGRIGRHGRELVRLFPELSAAGYVEPTRSDPETERHLLFESITDCLVAASRHAPVLFVLDDLHWADESTLVLLRHIARTAPESARLLIAGTYRETELGRDHPLAELLADFRRERVATRILLRGLGREDVAAMVGDVASAEVIETIHTETDGNPFFVEEIAAHLEETSGAGVGSDPDRVPEGVREVIGRRLSRLSEAANTALAAAAVAGREFDIAVLEVVTTLAEDDLLEALDAAEAAGLIYEVEQAFGRYTFRHALIRQVLYTELSALRRTRLHWRIGQAIAEQRPDDAPSIAEHLAEGALAGDPLTAARACVAAGYAFLDSLGVAEAVKFARRGLAVVESLAGHEAAEVRDDLLFLSAAAAQFGGDSPRAYRTWRDVAIAARDRHDIPRLTRAALLYGGFFQTNPDPLQFELLDAARAALGDADSDELATINAAIGMYRALQDGRTAAEPFLDEAMAMARRTGGDVAVGLALTGSGYGSYLGPDPQHALRTFDEGAPYLERALNRTFLGMNLIFGVFLSLQLGDRELLEHRLAAIEKARSQQPTLAWASLTTHATVALLEGRFTDVKRLLAEARAIERRAGEGSEIVLAALLHSARLEEGRAADVLARMGPFIEATPPLVTWRAMLAGAQAELGQLDDALRHLEVLLPLRELIVNDNWYQHVAFRHLTDVCCYLRDLDRAAALESLMLPYSGQIWIAANISAQGAADRSLGQVASLFERYEEAASRFDAALQLEEGLGATALAARTRLWYARSRLAAGDSTGATRLATEARDTAARLGMAAVERQAADMIPIP